MDNRWIWLILTVALAGRGALLVRAQHHPQGVATPDSAGYVELARNLAAYGQFAKAPDATTGYGVVQADPPGPAEIFRTPGYPAFLSAFFAMESPRGPLTGPGWVALLVQVVIDVGLVGLTYLLAWRLMGPTAALVAAALQAVTPSAIAASCRLLSDSLYALLLTAAVWVVVRGFRGRSLWSAAGAGALLAGACYVRPVALAMTVVVLAGLLASRRGLAKALVAAAVAGVMLTPWLVRNRITADYTGLSSFAATSLYLHAVPPLLAGETGVGEAEIRRQLLEEFTVEVLAAERQELTSGWVARHHQAVSAETIGRYPGAYAAMHARGNVGFWLPGATDVMEVAGLTTGQRGTLRVLRERGLWAAVKHYFHGAGWGALWVMPLSIPTAVK